MSAAANLVEGASKRGAMEFGRFLGISLGSLAELSYLLLVARDVGILPPDDYSRLDDLRNKANFLTWRLYRSIKETRGRTSNSPSAPDRLRTPSTAR